jgi:ferritin-like metal-binding protein YciE
VEARAAAGVILLLSTTTTGEWVRKEITAGRLQTAEILRAGTVADPHPIPAVQAMAAGLQLMASLAAAADVHPTPAAVLHQQTVVAPQLKNHPQVPNQEQAHVPAQAVAKNKQYSKARAEGPGLTLLIIEFIQIFFMKKATKSNSAANGNTAKANKSSNRSGQPASAEEGSCLLEKFFMDQLKDIYYAEQAIVKALPKMEEACTTDELKEAFTDHQHQSQKHIKRLEKVFTIMGEQPQGKKCEAIEGLIKEAESIIEETKEGSMTRDAALIMAAQKVEHYEIATYGGLVQLAITIGQREAAELLDRTLIEESQTDHMLTHIAESHINIEAEEESKYSSRRKEKERTAEITV